MSNEIKKYIDFELLINQINPAYKKEVQKFLEFCDRHGFTPESYKNFFLLLEQKDLSASTHNKYLSAIRTLIRKMTNDPNLTTIQKWELEKMLDSIKYKKINSVYAGDKILTPDEIENLIAHSPVRTALMIKFLWSTGCRINETCNITLKNCKINGITEIRLLGKGRKERFIKISTDLYNDIRKEFTGKKYLFETIHGNPVNDRNFDKEIRRIGKKVLNKVVSAHMLRHSFATEKIRKTGKIQAVSKYLGHSRTSTTLDLYVHETLSSEELEIT